ncbi:alkyl sulfatase C-terminal domain-containing protein [Microbacterium schleiferi]|uniref:alkyl sulfatase C-terminal domain-containing protein n=1 Tax=Microbacterium schleiferi TaxID=69362 RepID=UPI001E4F51B0|nr:alkyl sulfatase C-terminal domain-containing protein [Microbacterium schleiferi]
MLDSLAISVNGPAAWDLDLAFDLVFTDLDVTYRVTLRNGVLVYVPRQAPADAPLVLRMPKLRLLALLGGDRTSPGIEVEGDMRVFEQLAAVLEPGDPDFEIVLP